MNVFEQAARAKLRFESSKGLLSAEDLWDLPLTSAKGMSLDGIARALYHQLRSGNDISFVNPGTTANTTDQLRFDLVKHVIDTKMIENAAANDAAANDAANRKEKKQHLLGIIAQKEGEALTALSVDDLRKMVNDL